MQERLIKLRRSMGLSQEAFSEPLNLSRTAIASYEKGHRPLTDRTVADICRVYGVNEEWLRYGDGDMLKDAESREAELSSFVAKSINSDDEWLKTCAVRFFKLSPQSKNTFKKFLVNIISNNKDA